MQMEHIAHVMIVFALRTNEEWAGEHTQGPRTAATL